MRTTGQRLAKLSGVMLAFLLSGAFGIGSVASATAQSTQPHVPDKTLEGTWRVQVTIVDCVTGAQGAQFWSLLSFARGGTLTETTSNQALPGQRTSGHGVWGWVAPDRYTVASEAFLLFGAGVRPWTQRITQNIVMTSDEEFTSEASVEFSLTPGVLPAPPVALPPAAGCARAEGHRF